MEQKSTYGLIGYPVNHSLSPLMHNAAFEALGVEAVYELFSLEEQELDEFFVDLKTEESHIFGLNVTVPYKEKVVKYLDSLAPFAKKVNAVNTIVISKDRKHGGHLLASTIKDVYVKIDAADVFYMVLPRTESFYKMHFDSKQSEYK